MKDLRTHIEEAVSHGRTNSSKAELEDVSNYYGFCMQIREMGFLEMPTRSGDRLADALAREDFNYIKKFCTNNTIRWFDHDQNRNVVVTDYTNGGTVWCIHFDMNTGKLVSADRYKCAARREDLDVVDHIHDPKKAIKEIIKEIVNLK